jgi:cytochrome c peroxidase
LTSSVFLLLFSTNFCGKKQSVKHAYSVPDLEMPSDNVSNPDRIELGKVLYFDPRLSGSNWISCATCHNPAMGWGDGLPTAIGHNFQVLKRHSPSVINSAFYGLQFWDGRAGTLEEQAGGPIVSAAEMNQDMDELVKELSEIKGYVDLFNKAYPGEGISKSTITKAIATFERTAISKDSPFDKYMEGDKTAISESAQRGFDIFLGKAQCAVCHSGFNFSDNGFHNIGVKNLTENEDVGRFAVVPLPSMKGAFKTPTLRDIALSSPYMHNGIYKTLEEVIDHYDRKGDDKTNLSPNMQGPEPLNLSAEEKKDLVEFLKSLTGKAVLVTLPTLPN